MYFPLQFKWNYWKGPKPYTATSGWNYDKSLQSVKREQPAVLVLCHITNANAAELQHYSLFTQHVDRRSDWQPLWFPNAGPRGTLRQRSPMKPVYRATIGYSAIFRKRRLINVKCSVLYRRERDEPVGFPAAGNYQLSRKKEWCCSRYSRMQV